MDANWLEGWDGLHLFTINTKVQPRILECESLACSMSGGVMGALGCGWDVEFG